MGNLFLVRVELHSAGYVDYLNLHAAMEQLGFSRTIQRLGIGYQLPTAEYVISSSLNVTAIKNAAKSSANSTGKSSWVLAVQSAGVDWDLDLVR